MARKFKIGRYQIVSLHRVREGREPECRIRNLNSGHELVVRESRLPLGPRSPGPLSLRPGAGPESAPRSQSLTLLLQDVAGGKIADVLLVPARQDEPAVDAGAAPDANTVLIPRLVSQMPAEVPQSTKFDLSRPPAFISISGQILWSGEVPCRNLILRLMLHQAV